MFYFGVAAAAETSPPVLGLQFISCPGVNKMGSTKDLVVFVPNQEEEEGRDSAKYATEEEKKYSECSISLNMVTNIR